MKVPLFTVCCTHMCAVGPWRAQGASGYWDVPNGASHDGVRETRMKVTLDMTVRGPIFEHSSESVVLGVMAEENHS